MNPEIGWVIFLFFPTVSLQAPVFRLASICIRGYEILGLPVRTLLFVIIIDMGLSPEVLPVVGVHTQLSVMLCVREWTPHSLEMEHVEVDVFVKVFQQIDKYF